MDMIEVDPQLFIRCRLCLEDMGLYQIVPSIQLQIKYCFDIDVEPYDGLPQLLCKKCESILSEYYTRKKMYQEKQKSLKKLPQKSMEKTVQSIEEPQQEAVSSSQPTENEIDTSLTDKRDGRKENVETKSLKDISDDKVASNLIHCQTSTEKEQNNKQITSSYDITPEDQFTSEQTAPLKTTIKIISKTIETNKLTASLKEQKSNSNNSQVTFPNSWKNDYNKQYICRICEIQLRKKHSIKKHVATHDPWLHDYRDLFKAHCKVKMVKADNKPNITHLLNTVVLSDNRILLDEGNPQYYVNYVSKSYCETDSTKNNIEPKRKIKRNSYYDSSDDDIVVKRKQKKRRRLLSRSSNETVVIEGNDDKSQVSGSKTQNLLLSKSGKVKTIETECINIDDTSTDSSSYKNNSNKENKTAKQPLEANNSDYKTIQNIISMCHSKYLKRFESSDSDNTNKKTIKHSLSTESQLKHKVLSLGRKVINKQGFNSTGLLRYLEFKNLEIHWIPTLNVNNSKESNYVRIMTKLRGSDDSSNELGWKKVSESLIDKDLTEEKSNDTLYDSNLFVNADSDTVEEKSPILQGKKVNTDENMPRENRVPNNTISLNNIGNDSESLLKNKLLNANPVANPKHFPKKTNIIEIKPFITKITSEVIPSENDQNITSMSSEDTMFIDLDEEMSVNQMPMPIITSTTSLAPKREVKESPKNDNKTIDTNTVLPPATTENLDPKNQETNQEKPMSWLKVKPFSELMSERVLNNLNQQTNQQAVPNQALVSNSLWSIGHSQALESNNAQLLQNAVQPLYVRYDNSNMSVPGNETQSAPLLLNREHVVLDTVDLPNTRTDSPFSYFKNLLQIHGIKLLDMNEVLTREFNCLIKFKLVFHQELKQQAPVVLCLSLFCERNKFCLKVKDPSQEDVDVTKISANWQWEMLKAYKGDVVPKLLQNAQRISQEVFEYTKSFLCLLKSIKLKSSS